MARNADPRDLMVSTIHITNIHCPSCVAYVKDVLAPFSEAIHSLDISIIDHTARVKHTGQISRQIVSELTDASFEVEHVTVFDSSGRQVEDFSLQQASTPHRRSLLDKWFMSKAQRHHIKNCTACQEEQKERIFPHFTLKKTLGASIRRRIPTSTDVEHGIVETRTSSSMSSDQTIAVGSSKTPVNLPSDTYEATILIEGMTCASCVSAITKALEKHDYIEAVNINLVANSAKIRYRGPKEKAGDITDLIEDVGYDASLQDVTQCQVATPQDQPVRIIVSIDGMTCGSCVGTVTRGLQRLPFVASVDVDLVTNGATVICKNKDHIADVLEAIEDLGYEAALVRAEDETSVKTTTQGNHRSVQLQISGMYCPKCPTNIVDAISEVFANNVSVTQKPKLSDPRLMLSYSPSSVISIRQIIEVIDSVDPACTATIYHPPTLEERSRVIRHKEQSRILRHLFVATLIAIPSFVIGVVYMSLVPAENSIRRWFEEPIWAGNAMRIDWALIIVTTPAMFYCASIFHARALKEIWTLWRPKSKVRILRRFYRFGSMNLLISAGTSVAYFASVAVLIMDATTPRQGHDTTRTSSTYFDTVTFLTFFILIGRFLEAYSKAKTGDAVSMLANLRPRQALLIESPADANDEVNSATKQVSVDLLEVGDVIIVPHGACPPTDGAVYQDGNFLFDESSLTGESRPVSKTRNDKVYTGSINVGDPVRVMVAEVGGQSMLDQIINVVRDGQAKRAPIERLADILTGYFTPIITLIAIGTWIIWLALGESGALPRGWLDISRGGWPYWSVEFAIAVFVVACPCGVGLAAPTALFVGGGLAAQNGILVQGGGEAFQEASKLDAIVFDKTGTLTEGRMQVTDVELLDEHHTLLSREAAFVVAKSLEESSTHPIAKAIVQYCDIELDSKQAPRAKALNVRETPGQGMSGEFEIFTESGLQKFDVLIGNKRFFDTMATTNMRNGKNSHQNSEVSASEASNIFLDSNLSRLQSAGKTTAILAARQKQSDDQSTEMFLPVALFAITDPLRKDAAEVLDALRSHGLQVYMCTGDNQQTAQSIAGQVSIPAANVRAGVFPQDKATYIRELQSSSAKRKIVAFVGDGTNDTAALTMADVSIALSHSGGGGSDIALSSSSFVLLNSDLTSILRLVKLARRVFLRVKLNFMWAAVYNICLVPVAAGVFFPIGATWGEHAHGGFRLSPVWASLAMAGSSVSVVLSSLALRLPAIEFERVGRWWGRRMGRSG